jgi:hypothetical protein
VRIAAWSVAIGGAIGVAIGVFGMTSTVAGVARVTKRRHPEAVSRTTDQPVTENADPRG